MSSPRVVYVASNPAGIVLYVGVSGDLRRRLAVHKCRSAWWSEDVVVTVHEETANLEAILINQLRPVYNKINYDIWLERGDDLWQLTRQGLTRAEIRAATGIPNETLTRVLYPYYASRRS